MRHNPMFNWQEAWLSCKDNLRELIDPTAFCAFIGPLQSGVFQPAGASPDQKNILPLLAPNSYVARRVVEEYKLQIEDILRRTFSLDFSAYRLQVRVGDAQQWHSNPDNKGTGVGRTAASAWRPHPAPDVSMFEAGPDGLHGHLNDRHRLENFVVGDSNRAACQAATKVAQSILQSCDNKAHTASTDGYNPLVLYGSVGVGKTHLMQAIAWQLLAKQVSAVRYEGSNCLTKTITTAMQQRNIEAALNNYASLKVLLLDDVHLLRARSKTQEEVCQLFDTLVAKGSYLIVACDCHPSQLECFAEKLTSRFAGGTPVAIDVPDTQTKATILMNLAQLRGRSMEAEVALKIAKRSKVTSTPRDLAGLINSCCLNSDMKGIPISLSEAETCRQIAEPNISINRIKEVVADYYHLDPALLSSKSRKHSIAKPRQIAMWLCKDLTSASYPEIGEAFGGRNHSTVIHACKKVVALQASCATTRKDLRQIIKRLVRGGPG